MLTRKKPIAQRREPSKRTDRSDEFATWALRPAANAVMATPASLARSPGTPAAPPKLPRAARTDGSIRRSANGEACAMRVPGVCNGRTDTTVWSHWPGLDGDRGLGLKALDLCGCYACADCHDLIDGRRPAPPGLSYLDVQLAWLQGHLRSLVTLARKGLV